MAKKRSLLADKITGDNIYKALVFFDKLYAQMNEAEKREFLSQLVDNVQIYEERKENGQWLKSKFGQWYTKWDGSLDVNTKK